MDAGRYNYPALTAPADNGGTNDQTFITALYGNILHRTPSSAEVAYYVDALQGTLTTSTGAAIPAADRAQLLIYFSISPENQRDISGWLINSANGPYVQAGAQLTISSSTLGESVLTGTVNAGDYQSPTSATDVTYTTATGTTGIAGQGNTASGLPVVANEISTTDQNITINLDATINYAVIAGKNDTVNSASTGGSTVAAGDSAGPNAINNGGTINLVGTGNILKIGGSLTGASTPVTVNGFSAGDTMLANTNGSGAGELLVGNPASKINGAGITFFGSASQVGVVEVNVGTLNDDSAATMAKAANAVYAVGDVTRESVIFMGQDTSGNTMIFYWGHGDASGVHQVAASDFTGVIELVGVQTSALTNANFH